MMFLLLSSIMLGSLLGYAYGLAFVAKQERVFLYHKNYSIPTALVRILTICTLACLSLWYKLPAPVLMIGFIVAFVCVILQRVRRTN